MQLLAYGITYNEALASGMINSPRTLLITPTTAEVLAKGGYTKRTLIEDLVETARKPTYEWTFSKVYGSYGRVFGSFDRELQRELNDPRAAKGKLPPWYPRAPGWEDITTTPSIARDGIRILVCGDPSRNKAQVLAGGRGRSVKEVKLPARWDALMEQAGYRPRLVGWHRNREDLLSIRLLRSRKRGLCSRPMAQRRSRDATIAVCPGKKEKLMRARKVIARASLFIWVIACGSLVSSVQHGGAEPKSESRYPLITCEELQRLIDAKATQDIVIVGVL